MQVGRLLFGLMLHILLWFGSVGEENLEHADKDTIGVVSVLSCLLAESLSGEFLAVRSNHDAVQAVALCLLLSAQTAIGCKHTCVQCERVSSLSTDMSCWLAIRKSTERRSVSACNRSDTLLASAHHD